MSVNNVGRSSGQQTAAAHGLDQATPTAPAAASGIKDVAQTVVLGALGLPPPIAGVVGQIQNAVLGSMPEGPAKDILKFLIDPLGSLITMLMGGLTGADANKGYAPEAAPPAVGGKKSSAPDDKQAMADALDVLDKNFEVAAHADKSVDEYVDYQPGISERDLQAIVSGQGFSPELKKAAAYLLDHPEDFKKLTGATGSGTGTNAGDVPSLSHSECKGALETVRAQLDSSKKAGESTAKTSEPTVKATPSKEPAKTEKAETTTQADHLENAASKFEHAAESIEDRMDEVSGMMDKLGPDGKYTDPGGKVWTTASLNAEMTKLSNRYQTVMQQVNALNTLISNISKMYSDMQMNAIRHIQ